MRIRNCLPLLMVLMAALAAPRAAVHTVSKDGRGSFSSIQAAVDKANPYDEIEILDAAVYPEQVTVKFPLHHLTLRSGNPASAVKPTIRFNDQTHVSPKTCAESLDTAKIDFDKNGALRLINTRAIRIEGIRVDGGAPTAYAYASIWGSGVNCTSGAFYPLFFGNAGLVVHSSSHTWLRDCEITGAYFGLYIKDQDNHGPFQTGDSRADANRFGRMALGNHLIEGNAFHHNTWAVFVERTLGCGSTFRNNLVYENHHADAETALRVKAMPDGDYQAGGAFLFKDGQQSPLAILNNTLSRNYLLFCGLFRSGAQHLVADNIFAAPYLYWASPEGNPFVSPFTELSSAFPRRMKYNAFAAQALAPEMDSMLVQAHAFDSAAGQEVSADKAVPFGANVRITNSFPSPEAAAGETLVEVPLTAGPVQVKVTLPARIYPGALVAEPAAGIGLTAEDQNRWLETAFLSGTATDSGFLSPAPPGQPFLRRSWPALNYRNASGLDAGIGALPAKARPGPLMLAPLAPVSTEGDSLVLRFSIHLPQGALPTAAPAPTLAYLRLVRKTPLNPEAFGFSEKLAIAEADPLALPEPLRYGYNEIRMARPGPALDSLAFGFVEMAVRGSGTMSNVASLPILPGLGRSGLRVEALQQSADSPVVSLARGGILRVRVSSLTSSSATKVSLFLASGAALEILDTAVASADPAGFLRAALPFTVAIRLNESPDGGSELILATASEGGSGTGRILLGISPPLPFADAVLQLRGKRSTLAPRAEEGLRGRNLLGRKERSGRASFRIRYRDRISPGGKSELGR
ncbi:MAG: hypothetical protein ABI036_07615 [Fibrobacteria bacterium]